jgi:Lrp/AsnC family transcriptional regulator of ectoine degradation
MRARADKVHVPLSHDGAFTDNPRDEAGPGAQDCLACAMKLDKFDIQILDILQREGRITKLELAQRIGLSQTPCHERVKRLENLGVVRGYHADVDIDRLVDITRVYVTVTLERHKAADFERFESAINKVPEILECYALGGGIDYFMSVVTLDLPSYQALMEKLLNMEIGIAQYFSYIVTKSIKRSHGFPITHLVSPE